MPQRQLGPHRQGDRQFDCKVNHHAAERGGAAVPACPVEDIAQAYLVTTHGDAGLALRCAITDALSDLMEAERRARENSRLISRGYVRDTPRG